MQQEEAEWAKKALADALMRRRDEELRRESAVSREESSRNAEKLRRLKATAEHVTNDNNRTSIKPKFKSNAAKTKHSAEVLSPIKSVNNDEDDNDDEDDEYADEHYDEYSQTEPDLDSKLKSAAIGHKSKPKVSHADSTDESNSYSDDFQESLSINFNASNKPNSKSELNKALPPSRTNHRYPVADVNTSLSSTEDSVDESAHERREVAVNARIKRNKSPAKPTPATDDPQTRADAVVHETEPTLLSTEESAAVDEGHELFDKVYADRLLKPLKENLSRTLLSSQVSVGQALFVHAFVWPRSHLLSC